MPWITQGLLVSMHVRDKLYKQLKLKKSDAEKDHISRLHKRYHNMTVNLLRVSKKICYSSFFQENQSNVEKPGMVYEL